MLAVLALQPVFADDGDGAASAQPAEPKADAAAEGHRLKVLAPPEQSMLPRPASREIGDSLTVLDDRGKPAPRITLDVAQPSAPAVAADATELTIRPQREPVVGGDSRRRLRIETGETRRQESPLTKHPHALGVTIEAGSDSSVRSAGASLAFRRDDNDCAPATRQSERVAPLGVVADDASLGNTVRLTMHDDGAGDAAASAPAERVESSAREPRDVPASSSSGAQPPAASSFATSAIIPSPHEPVVEVRRTRLIRAKADIEATMVVDESVCKIEPVNAREAWLVAKTSGTTRVAFRFADHSRPPFTCLVRVLATPPRSVDR